MKKFNLVLLMSLTLGFINAQAQGAKRSTQAIRTSCSLCDRMTQYSEELRTLKNIEDEAERSEKSNAVVVKAADAVSIRLRTAKTNKLSTLEIDSILKFEAEFQNEDPIHQLLELIHPFYVKDKSMFDGRIKKLSEEHRKIIQEMLKNYEREQKQGNG